MYSNFSFTQQLSKRMQMYLSTNQ